MILKIKLMQFNLQDLATLLHDSLLFSKPAFEGNPLREEGVLQLALATALLGAGNAGRDFEQAHGIDPQDLPVAGISYPGRS